MLSYVRELFVLCMLLVGVQKASLWGGGGLFV